MEIAAGNKFMGVKDRRINAFGQARHHLSVADNTPEFGNLRHQAVGNRFVDCMRQKNHGTMRKVRRCAEHHKRVQVRNTCTGQRGCGRNNFFFCKYQPDMGKNIIDISFAADGAGRRG